VGRQARLDIPAATYFLSMEDNDRSGLFRCYDDRRYYLDILRKYSGHYNYRVLAYVLLLHRVALLIKPEGGGLPRIMQRLQSLYVQDFNRRHGRRGHLFKSRYRSLVVDTSRHLVHMTRYIHLLPVSEGVVNRPEKYEWSSYRFYVTDSGDSWVATADVLESFGGNPAVSRQRYRRYVESGIGDGSAYSLPEVTSSQVIGSGEFLDACRARARNPGPDRRGADLQSVLGALLDSVAAEYAVSTPVSLRVSRARKYVSLRQLFCYLAREYTNGTLREIGDFISMRTPESVAVAVGKFKKRLEREPELAARVARIVERSGVNRVFPG